MPRAATSVATRTRCLPFWKPLRAAVRWDWLRSPWMTSASWPRRSSFFADAVGAVLGAREDEEGSLLFAQHLVEEAELLVLHDGVDAEFDAVGGLGGLADGDANGVANVVADDLLDVGVERGGVAHGLTGLRHGADDAADGGKEAHVEHAVDFVEDEHFDGVEVDLAAAEVVFETAGSGDDEAWAAVELIELVVLREASADEHRVVLRAGD